jgi:hypothetical protein
MLDHTKDQFEGYWKHLTEEEKKSILHPENMKNDQISKNLIFKGFIVEKNQEKEIFSPLFCNFIDMKIHHLQKEEILVFTSSSMLLSAITLEIIDKNVSFVQGFPEIFIQKLDASTQVLSLMIFFIWIIPFFLLFTRIETVQKLKYIKNTKIFSKNKRLFYVGLVLMIVPLLYFIGLQDVGWNLLGEAISVSIAYYLLKIHEEVI